MKKRNNYPYDVPLSFLFDIDGWRFAVDLDDNLLVHEPEDSNRQDGYARVAYLSPAAPVHEIKTVARAWIARTELSGQP